MKKFFLIGLVISLGVSFAGLPDAHAKNYYSFGTASTAGTWYIIGAGFSSHINKHYPKVKLTAEITAGSVEDYYLLKRKKMDISLTTPDIVGDDVTKQKYGGGTIENVRMVMWSYHTSDWHWIVRKESPIRDICDCKGKKVGVGPHGTKGMEVSLEILEVACGYKPDKQYDALYYTYGESQTGLRDNTIDMGNTIAGYPVASVMDLANSIPIRIISMTPEQIKKCLEVRPTNVKIIIPAGTYKGVDYDVVTVGGPTGIVCRPGIPEEDIYGILKALFTNIEDRNVFHPQAKKYTIEATVNIGQPLTKLGVKFHPGAIKFLKEKGAWSPELEAK
jgi:TRAP transporter TAXI family solute receptor